MTGSAGTYRPAAPTTAPLAGHVDADAVVVGAGIAGVALAVQLAERGADVVLVTDGAVGAGVTGRSSAKVTSLHQLVYADLVDRHGAGAAATYAEANQDAVAWLRERARAAGAVEGEQPVWEDVEAITVARDERELADLRAEEAAGVVAGLPLRLEDGTGAWPDAVGALRLPDQGQVEPVGLLRALLASGPAGRIRLHEGTRVLGAAERPGRATVRTADGATASAPAVVVATGLPILDRGAFFALCEPQASYVVAIEDPAADRAGHPAMITAGEPKRSVRWATGPQGRRLLLVGGEGHRTGTGAPTTPRYARLEAWARDTYPGLGDVVARWSAEDFMSPDRLPFAGPELRLGGPVHVITGLSKWGLTLGTACATALAARLDDGTRTAFGDLVDTARLPGLRGTKSVVESNAQVARHMAGGWAAAMTRTAPTDPAEGEGGVGRAGVLPRARCRVGGTTHDRLAVCPHLGGVVTWNEGDGTWDCPLHGSRFEADGTVRHGPAVHDLR